MSPDQKQKGILGEWMRYANIGIEMMASVLIRSEEHTSELQSLS